MKSKLVALLLLLSINTVLAQKAKVQAAYNYLKYEQLDKAKEAIDQAAMDEGSKDMDKTWYYRGLIYESISNSDKFRSMSPDASNIALMSYQKALVLDPNSEFKGEISTRLNYVKTDLFNNGVAAFRDKKYTDALSDFENVLKVTPNDSSTVLYSAYSAERAKDNSKAIGYYQKMITLKYDDASTYRSLMTLYKQQGDNDHALYTLEQARKKYPDDQELLLSQINIYLPQGKNKEAIDLMNQALAKDPKNASLFFALGATYDKMANTKDASGNYPADRVDLIQKAKDAYKKSIEIKSDNFEANYNLGALYFNEGAEALNGVTGIKDPKEYAAAKQRVDSIFSLSQPYLEKAYEINPKDHDTLLSLKQLYFRQNNMDKYYRMKTELEALGK